MYPTPRVDRWDPWMAGIVLLMLAACALMVRVF